MKSLTPIMAIVWLSACASSDLTTPATTDEPREVAAVSGELNSAPDAEEHTVDKLADGAAPAAKLNEWQLRESLSRSPAGIKPEKRPDGTSQVSLKGRFMSASVVHRDNTGKRQQTCIDTPEAADRIFGAKR